MMKFFFPAIAIPFLVSCGSPDKPVNVFSDPGMVRIADFQDRRLADSLYPYFGHPDAALRSRAVHAFGSLQSADQVDRIGKLLLMDPEPSVRMSAAFALGQIQDPSCERLLLGALVKEKEASVAAEVLESYGKATRRWNLDPAALMRDSVTIAGLAWSLYRAGLRGKTDENASALATTLLSAGQPERARLGAAHYFARSANSFPGAISALADAGTKDPSPNVRMAAALALGKSKADTALATLKSIIKEDRDPRVVVNAVRALGNFPFGNIKHYLYEQLNHPDAHVGIAASEVLIETIIADDWIEVSSLTGQVKDWRILANVYAAALKAGQNPDLAAEIQRRYASTQNLYERAALLGSLKHYPPAYEFVTAVITEADTAVLRSSAAAALAGMNQSAGFPARLTARFAAVYEAILGTTDDPAVIGAIATALGDSLLNYRVHFPDGSVLYDVREKLTLPENIEARLSVEMAIAHLDRHEISANLVNPFNHPIDWDLVKKIPQDHTATIKTTRGSIIIRLKVNEAPGSVANFVSLARADYFDDRVIHRVVPNFVVQDGCKRGDGWGSEDYSLRSEFASTFYGTGSVGMASAGKDTEGTQWFITHSPTPHLEGRYTLFGEVVEGQAVVDYLRVGDKVLDVEVKDFTGP